MRKILIILVALLCVLPCMRFEAAEGDPVVIVIDPGHDATHGGAEGNGLQEDKLNLKIAQYCVEELSTYKNVKIYMTRDSASCPYPGGSSGKDNSRRVEFAQSVGADAYVSLHLNSLDDTSYGGVEIFYPNNSYRPKLSTVGAGLSQAILDELVGLGLKNHGIKIRNANVSKYDDGSVGDYYQVIREAKIRNITGIIVEHAFISCPSDAENFLSTDAKLKALGVADATGIAKYYGLQKESGDTSSGVVSPQEPEVPQEPEEPQESETPQEPVIPQEPEPSESEEPSETEESTEIVTETEEPTETEGMTEINTESEESIETEEMTESMLPTESENATEDVGANAGGISDGVLVCLILMGMGCVACIGLVVYILMRMKTAAQEEIFGEE